jgi:ubiquinone/menaquinone biosynthesis C-methylase UbiE
LNPMMTYIGAGPTGARKYVGDVAAGYDAKRENSAKWRTEQQLIESLIGEFPEGATVLDTPVGTGRFIPAYERKGLKWTGIDLSSDMLTEAGAKVTRPELAKLRTGDVTRLDEITGEKSFDLAIMCRLTRWLSPAQRFTALGQLQRATRKGIVFTARIANHPHAYPMQDIEAALDGWAIAGNLECADPAYRVIVLESVA